MNRVFNIMDIIFYEPVTPATTYAFSPRNIFKKIDMPLQKGIFCRKRLVFSFFVIVRIVEHTK